jgi:hypothetical protein
MTFAASPSGEPGGTHARPSQPIGACDKTASSRSRLSNPRPNVLPLRPNLHAGGPSGASPNERVPGVAFPIFQGPTHTHGRPSGDSPRSKHVLGWEPARASRQHHAEDQPERRPPEPRRSKTAQPSTPHQLSIFGPYNPLRSTISPFLDPSNRAPPVTTPPFSRRVCRPRTGSGRPAAGYSCPA